MKAPKPGGEWHLNSVTLYRPDASADVVLQSFIDFTAHFTSKCKFVCAYCISERVPLKVDEGMLTSWRGKVAGK